MDKGLNLVALPFALSTEAYKNKKASEIISRGFININYEFLYVKMYIAITAPR